MTEVINEVNDTQSVLQSDPIAPKAKAKRTASKKLVVAAPLSEPEVTIEASLEDVEATVTLPKEVAKEDLKIACPDCGKKMSAKTLKYSHGPNCAAQKKQKINKHQITQLASLIMVMTTSLFTMYG